jgi:hypothetical protein
VSADGLRHHDEVLVMLTRRNLLALAWYDAPRPGHLPAVQRVVEDLHRTHGKYGLLDVVVRGTPSFPDQVREEGRRLIETTHGWGGVTAHIIEVEGFAGTRDAHVPLHDAVDGPWPRLGPEGLRALDRGLRMALERALAQRETRGRRPSSSASTPRSAASRRGETEVACSGLARRHRSHLPSRARGASRP